MPRISLLRAAVIALALVAGFAAQRALAEDEEPQGWTGEVAASFAAQTGTIDTLNGELDAKTERMWEKDLAGARVTAAFGQTRDRNDNPSDDRTTQNSQALFLNHRRTINSRYLWRSGLELSRDPTVDREVRVALASGPGYLFWQGDNKEKQFFA